MLRLFLASVSTTALSAGSAAAQTWTGATSSDWTVGTNWSTGSIPTTSSAVNMNTGTAVLGVAGASTGSTGTINVGNLAGSTGTLVIQNGSTLTGTSSSRIGIVNGGTGIVTVTGSGSVWTTTSFTVGFAGNGTLNIQNGGRVYTAGNVTTVAGLATSSGTINISSGGTLETNGLHAGPGTAQVNFDNGILKATGANATFINGFSGTKLNLQAGGVTIDTASFAVGTDTTSGFTGVGGLTVTGGGIFTLAANSTYSGQTQINAGSGLTLQGAGAIASSSRVVANGTLDISGVTPASASIKSLAGSGAVTLGAKNLVITNANDAFSGAISGTGGLTLNSGTETLTGTNTYTGATTINGGTLTVNGSLASNVTVAAGTLSGSGTVGTTQVNTGATVSPGNGTAGSGLTVAGNLTFQAGSTYFVQTTVQTASFTDVTGTASLAGTAQAYFSPGSYIKKTYTILTSAGLGSTTFTTFSTTNLPAGFTASLAYTGTDVLMNLDAQYNGGSSSCVSVNACAVASSVKGFFDNGGALPPQFQSLFGLTGAALPASLSQLSGEVTTGTQNVVFRMTDQFLNVMLDPFVGIQVGHFDRFTNGGGRMSLGPDRRTETRDEIAQAHGELFRAPGLPDTPAAEDRAWSVWGTAFGGGNRTVGDVNGSGTHDVTATTYGFAAGLDYRVSSNTVAGVAVGLGGTDWGMSDGLGTGRSTAVQVGLYSATHSGPAYLATALAFSNHWVKTDRTALGDRLSAGYGVVNLGGRVEGGYRFDVAPGFGVIPYAAIQTQVFRMPGFSEADGSGMGFGLTYAAADATDTRGELGARFQYLTEIGGAPVTLLARLGWAHDWVSNPNLTAAFQALPGASFVVNGTAQPADSALTSVGAEVWLSRAASLLAKFDGEFAGTSQTYGGTAKLRYTF